jgi:hypothetical protein
MDAKLREMIDRQEIWQVLQRYARGLDRLDRQLVRSCYFDDAIEDHGAYVGRPDDFIEWANESTLLFLNTHHGLMNHYCEIEGDDAHAETYYLFIGVAEKPPHLLSMGRYIDHFQRRNGEWRIANRVAVIEKNFDLQDGTPWDGGRPQDPDAAPATRDRSDVSYQRPLRPRRPRRT